MTGLAAACACILAAVSSGAAAELTTEEVREAFAERSYDSRRFYSLGRYTAPEDWRRRTETKILEVPQGALNETLDVMAEGVFGLGAAIAEERGCKRNILEQEDFAAILALWSGEAASNELSGSSAKFSSFAETANAHADAATAFMKDGFGKFFAVKQAVLLPASADGGKGLRLTPTAAVSIADHIAGRNLSHGWRLYVPFVALRDPDNPVGFYVRAVFTHARRYYEEKVKVCGLMEGQEEQPSIRGDVIPVTSLSEKEKDLLRNWIQTTRAQLGNQMSRQYLKDAVRYGNEDIGYQIEVRSVFGGVTDMFSGNVKRRKEYRLEGTVNIAFSVRRDGQVLDWKIESTDLEHEQFADAVDALAARAMRKLNDGRIEPFPYMSDTVAVEMRLRMVY